MVPHESGSECSLDIRAPWILVNVQLDDSAAPLSLLVEVVPPWLRKALRFMSKLCARGHLGSSLRKQESSEAKCTALPDVVSNVFVFEGITPDIM